jgi:hypothetical protein
MRCLVAVERGLATTRRIVKQISKSQGEGDAVLAEADLAHGWVAWLRAASAWKRYDTN